MALFIEIFLLVLLQFRVEFSLICPFLPDIQPSLCWFKSCFCFLQLVSVDQQLFRRTKQIGFQPDTENYKILPRKKEMITTLFTNNFHSLKNDCHFSFFIAAFVLHFITSICTLLSIYALIIDTVKHYWLIFCWVNTLGKN